MKLSKDGALAKLEELGKSMVWNATPSNYPAEKHSYAKWYADRVPYVRQSYARIQAGQDIGKTLDWLASKIETGIERNKIDNLKDAYYERLDPRYRQVIDGYLVFIK